ncbi:hypothetical protein M409DRAFT_64302 [Zasmidium cellare ATCC 36951]|uniref:Programmed cell death protein 2 C-terminal domain-containing protein n=1 Tax=Zasmidium cellare ATCC 36951 TaxID=1080233 RepID=A0A6A6CZ41_ZASCE|nr:uncharacterized protein M409DRAFT_64302 [Zasmidium cellare ATCC 36951]KAF2170636.1 hypothetical protein M409DRAFT_64302 [Zasmidium cellare ATCC 36951]
MADYDSDSSGAEDIATNVLLGYASREPTSDDFSQLGGHPTWLDDKTAPSGSLAKCRVCNGLMNLLLQINGDLPERFPGHERRLYLWACRKKTCRRKEGSVRAFRATRQTAVQQVKEKREEKSQPKAPAPQPANNLGETLFGVKPGTNTQANPIASGSSSGASANPFAANGTASNPFSSASSLAAKPPQQPEVDEAASLPETFAQKARITDAPSPETQPSPKEPWPSPSNFPDPLPHYHLDADTEYIEASADDQTPSNVQIDRGEGSSGGSGADDKTLFESTMDKTFQRFADHLSQNPEQVLRYDFEGQPLLYSKSDKVGKLFAEAAGQEGNVKVKTQGGGAKIPRCNNCGAARVFELQLTPHVITELEADEMSIDGMDWGTIILGVCSKDCQESGIDSGEVGYVEEWVGVQWEELAGTRRPA